MSRLRASAGIGAALCMVASLPAAEPAAGKNEKEVPRQAAQSDRSPGFSGFADRDSRSGRPDRSRRSDDRNADADQPGRGADRWADDGRGGPPNPPPGGFGGPPGMRRGGPPASRDDRRDDPPDRRPGFGRPGFGAGGFPGMRPGGFPATRDDRRDGPPDRGWATPGRFPGRGPGIEPRDDGPPSGREARPGRDGRATEQPGQPDRRRATPPDNRRDPPPPPQGEFGPDRRPRDDGRSDNRGRFNDAGRNWRGGPPRMPDARGDGRGRASRFAQPGRGGFGRRGAPWARRGYRGWYRGYRDHGPPGWGRGPAYRRPGSWGRGGRTHDGFQGRSGRGRYIGSDRDWSRRDGPPGDRFRDGDRREGPPGRPRFGPPPDRGRR
jgi:hypothetical protein